MKAAMSMIVVRLEDRDDVLPELPTAVGQLKSRPDASWTFLHAVSRMKANGTRNTIERDG